MARPRSEDKRQAILDAATRLFAEQGLQASTAAIAKAAGVAEGTFFTYFPSKDDLLNRLYLELKGGLRAVMVAAYPRGESMRNQIRHAWQAYVQWGAAHPEKRRVMAKLSLSERVSPQARAEGMQAFEDINAMLMESIAQGVLRDQPPAFVSAILTALADTAMDFMVRYPQQADQYSASGFEAFWNAIVQV